MIAEGAVDRGIGWTERLVMLSRALQQLGCQHAQSDQGSGLAHQLTRIERRDHRFRGHGKHGGQRRQAAE